MRISDWSSDVCSSDLASWQERKRLFELPRSSWQDYDTSLLSEGGGVHSRSVKSISLTPQVCEALDIDAESTSMSPAELMQAILKAPVDLLWNGGIGTYLTGSPESRPAAGDKANQPTGVAGENQRGRG